MTYLDKIADKISRKLASYFPTQENLKPIIAQQLEILKKKYTNLNGVRDISTLDLSKDIENNVKLYVQLNVDPDRYHELLRDTENINIMFQTFLTPILNSKFQGYKFTIKIGFFPE